MPSVDEDNELQRAREISRIRDLRQVFLEVFGPPGVRTRHGGIILKELERFANYRRPIRVTDSTGATDIYGTARMEGRREVLQSIHDLIEWKEEHHVDARSTSP